MTVGAISRDRVARALTAALGRDTEEAGVRVEIIPKDGMILLFLPIADELDCFSLLRCNAEYKERPWGPAAVVDPETGQGALRHVIPFRIWSRPDLLRRHLQGTAPRSPASGHSLALRLLRSVPAGVTEFRFGPAGRLALFPDLIPPLLAAQVFPGGIIEEDLSEMHGELPLPAWVLLARSGVAGWPFHFHMLRSGGFLGVERAAAIRSATIAQEELRAAEASLIREAEEDRRILSAMVTAGALRKL